MINVIISMIQMYLENKSKSSTDFSKDLLFHVKERGKEYALAFLMSFLSSLFIFAGLVLFIVEIGLQIDRGLFFSFSGLVVSSGILIGISILCALMGFYLVKEPKEHIESKAKNQPADELKNEVYEIALMFLREFKENHNQQKVQE